MAPQHARADKARLSVVTFEYFGVHSTTLGLTTSEPLNDRVAAAPVTLAVGVTLLADLTQLHRTRL